MADLLKTLEAKLVIDQHALDDALREHDPSLIKDMEERYKEHKRHAAERGIEFKISFSEWVFVWQSSGKYNKRGRRKHEYCMARFGDTGPYAIWNVEIITSSKNGQLSHIGRVQLESERLKRKITLTRSKKLTEEQITQIRVEYKPCQGKKTTFSKRALAEKYGVCWLTIHNVIDNKLPAYQK